MYDLRSFRKSKKLNQSDIADLFSCVQSNVSDIERYKRDLTPEQLSILIDKYGESEVMKYYITDNSILFNRISGGKNNTYGSGNIGGHNVHLSVPESIKPKIINDDEIVITCEDASSQEAQRKTEALILENQALKDKIDLKDELIQSLRDQIEILKGNKS